MVRWIYSEPHGTDFATGATGSDQNRARPSKTARGPPKVRLACLLSSHAMYLAIGRDRASIEVWNLIEWKHQRMTAQNASKFNKLAAK